MPVGQVTGLGSGIQWDQTIDQLMEIEKQPLYSKQNRIKQLKTKKSAWEAIHTQLKKLKDTMESLDEAKELKVKTASSSDTNILSVVASDEAVPGNYAIKINQLANGHKVISQGFTSLSETLFQTAGKFTYYGIGGEDEKVEISVTENTSIADLKRKINAASDGDVTASIMNDGDSDKPYRIILNSKSTGEESVINIALSDGATWKEQIEFRDVAISDSIASSENSSDAKMQTLGKLYSGNQNSYTYEVISGGTVGSSDITFKIKDKDGNYIKEDGNDMIITYSASGSTDKQYSGIDIKFKAGDNLTAGDKFSIETNLPTARDAKLEVENISISKSSNQIRDIIEGVDINLLDLSSEDVSVTVENDRSGVKKLINNFVNDYNTVVSAVIGYTSWNEEDEKGGALFGESIASEIKSSLATIISNENAGIEDGQYFRTLSQIGIKLSDKGRLDLDSSKFEKALEENFDEVLSIFTKNSSLSGGDSDKFILHNTSTKTRGGSYDINVVVDNEGNITSATIGGKVADIKGSFISGKSGTNMEGLQIWVDTEEAKGTSISSTAKYATGKFVELINQVDYYTREDSDPELTGAIDVAKDSINSSIEDINNRIESLQRRLEIKRNTLERQWLAMEKAVTAMRNQQSRNAAMLG